MEMFKREKDIINGKSYKEFFNGDNDKWINNVQYQYSSKNNTIKISDYNANNEDGLFWIVVKVNVENDIMKVTELINFTGKIQIAQTENSVENGLGKIKLTDIEEIQLNQKLNSLNAVALDRLISLLTSTPDDLKFDTVMKFQGGIQ